MICISMLRESLFMKTHGRDCRPWSSTRLRRSLVGTFASPRFAANKSHNLTPPRYCFLLKAASMRACSRTHHPAAVAAPAVSLPVCACTCPPEPPATCIWRLQRASLHSALRSGCQGIRRKKTAGSWRLGRAQGAHLVYAALEKMTRPRKLLPKIRMGCGDRRRRGW